MLFSSIPFLYYFLPAVLLLYFIAPKKLKNGVLLITSLVFYGWGEPKYVLLMIASIIMGYVFGLLIEKFRGTKLSKLFLILSICTGVITLGYFKYSDFFIQNFNAVTNLNVPLLKVALPIGISFFTFQILSYTVDVYRGSADAQKNIISFASYVAMFPQLIAGPIVRYTDIVVELNNRKLTVEQVYLGLSRFIAGLAKKVLIANLLGELCSVFKSTDEKTVVFYWIYAVAYSLHIYFDFSGYSDMAIGLGKIFGFSFPENFNYPYISKSITEFWRRWHITLGSWFRDYVYIPLGGNRVNSARWIFNILVVWMLTGFWHGAAWNFVVWGLMFAVLLVAEKLFLNKILAVLPSFFKHLYVTIIIMVSFVLFDSASLGEAAANIGGMFGLSGAAFINEQAVYYLQSYAVVIILGIIGATPLIKRFIGKINPRALTVIRPVILIILLLTVTAFLVDGSFNPFLYFRF